MNWCGATVTYGKDYPPPVSYCSPPSGPYTEVDLIWHVKIFQTPAPGSRFQIAVCWENFYRDFSTLSVPKNILLYLPFIDSSLI